jgi:hypothetical protein
MCALPNIAVIIIIIIYSLHSVYIYQETWSNFITYISTVIVINITIIFIVDVFPSRTVLIPLLPQYLLIYFCGFKKYLKETSIIFRCLVSILKCNELILIFVLMSLFTFDLLSSSSLPQPPSYSCHVFIICQRAVELTR